MRIYPETVISSQIPYGHFGSGVLPMHANILVWCLQQMCVYITWTIYFTKHTHTHTHVSTMCLLVWKWFPHPMGVVCTHLEPPKSHIGFAFVVTGSMLCRMISPAVPVHVWQVSKRATMKPGAQRQYVKIIRHDPAFALGGCRGRGEVFTSVFSRG